MRVIGGVAGSIPLEVVSETAARPFLEKARGALFNSLGPRIAGARVLDLYAGSGALGIEALSRGAASAVFVEADRRSAKIIETNLERCRLRDAGRVIHGRVEHVLPAECGPFDLVFVDPPFACGDTWEAEGMALRQAVTSCLSDAGLVVFRLERPEGEAPDWEGLALLKDRRYGRSRVCRYGRPPSGSQA